MHENSPYHNSPILNEIHNHFPALLYDGEQFRSINEIFSYVRIQMQNRFDVYSNMRRNFHSNRPQRYRHFSPPRHTPRPPPAPHTHTSQPQAQAVMTELDINNTILNMLNHNDFNSIIYAAIGGLRPNETMDAVVVAPTEAQISNGSTICTSLRESDSPCSICQDSIQEGEITRHLSYCGHIFHRNCIDTWYQRNVHCPVCRHDIREVQPTVTP
jgi:hypothetical protein